MLDMIAAIGLSYVFLPWRCHPGEIGEPEWTGPGAAARNRTKVRLPFMEACNQGRHVGDWGSTTS